MRRRARQTWVDGTLTVGGDFTATRNNTAASVQAFVSTGTEVVLVGTGASISMFASSTTANRFSDLTVQGTANMTSTVWVTGLLTVEAGATLSQDAAIILHLTSLMPVIAGSWSGRQHPSFGGHYHGPIVGLPRQLDHAA